MVIFLKNKAYFCFLFFVLFLALPAFAQASCVTAIVPRNASGDFIPDARVEVYEQSFDVDRKPKPGKLLGSATVDKVLGKASLNLSGNATSTYAMKIKVLNTDVSNYWFYNQDLRCGAGLNLDRVLSSIRFVLRDVDGNLRKNTAFNVYTQKYDIDNNPIKEKKDLVGTFNTGERGEVIVYVPEGSVRSLDGKINDYYILEIGKSPAQFIKYNIAVADGQTTNLEYIFSDAKLNFKNARLALLPDKSKVQIYKQEIAADKSYKLGAKVADLTLNNQGYVIFEYPAGNYAAVVQDGLLRNNIFWNIKITDGQRVEKSLVTNLTRIEVKANVELADRDQVTIYSMVEGEKGYYYKDKEIGKVSINKSAFVETSLGSAPYLLVYAISDDSVAKFYGNVREYGKAFWAENGKLQTVTINIPKDFYTSGQKYKLTPPGVDYGLAGKLAGQILLQTESHGEAWYVNMNDKLRYYMENGNVAYTMMRNFGTGISSNDLKKIPVGFLSQVVQTDSDGDGLPDKTEEALGTNPNKADSDGDGFSDGQEVKGAYNPLGSGKMPIDLGFSSKQKGKILLQVDSRGEAWYINPKDGKRYYMKDGAAAYEIMRYLSVGIKNSDIEKLLEGSLSLN